MAARKRIGSWARAALEKARRPLMPGTDVPPTHGADGGIRGLRQPQALLLCGVGTGNVGNDASLRTAVERLRDLRPDVTFTVATPFVDGARQILTMPVIPMRQNMAQHRGLHGRQALARAVFAAETSRLRDAVRLLRSTDLVVVTGTGIFDDFGERPWNMPYALLTWSGLARLLGRPFVFMAVGAGPVENPLCRIQFRMSALLASAVSYRDRGSLEFMRSIGAGRRDARVVPDLVFGAAVPGAPPAVPGGRSMTVGLGVMAYGGWSELGEGPVYEAYVRCLVEVFDRLLSHGHRVTMLVGQPCDLPVVDDVLAASAQPHEGRVDTPPIVDFDDLLRAIGSTDLVIGTRYHNVVAALMMNRPVVSMSYAPKNADLMRDLGIEGFDRPIEEATPDWVMDRVDDIRSGRTDFDARAWGIVDGWARGVEAEVARVWGLCGRGIERRDADSKDQRTATYPTP